MKLYKISKNPDERYQIITITLPYGKDNLRLRFEIRYLNEPGLWCLSLFNLQTGEACCRYVPLIASYGAVNNLLEPFAYKKMGCLAVIPLVEKPQSENPGLNNLNEFEIVWGESFAE